MFNTTCTNKLKCHNGTRYCTSSKHAPHHKLSCDKPATHGRVGTKDREYCKECMNQLIRFQKLVGEYVKTNTKCIDQACTVDDPKQVVYGFRGQSPTHCKAHSESNIQLINLKAGKSCSMLDSDSNYCCKMQGTKLVGTEYYCTKHATTMSDQVNLDVVSTRPMCIVDGCDKSRTVKNYCITHAREHGFEHIKNKCSTSNCTKQASFKVYEDTNSARYCKECSGKQQDKKIVSTNKMCELCNKTRASFKGGPTGNGFMCKGCTPKNDSTWISISTKRSIVESIALDGRVKSISGCQTQGCAIVNPSFGLLWKRPTHCQEHKDDNMLNVVSIKCAVHGCTKYRLYGYDWRRPIVCKTHVTGGMQNVVSKRCLHCTIIASYGHEWQKPTHCMSHGLNEDPPMRNVVSKLCAVSGCKTRPTFGIHVGSSTHCVAHKTDQMLDAVHQQCHESNCAKRACFGTEAGTPEYCVIHKTKNMEDVVHTKCLDSHCKTRPSFGLEFGSAQYCVDHKTDDMNDVVSKRCEMKGCLTQAIYNHAGLMAKYCSQHKNDNMINVKATECGYDGCSTQASFANEGDPSKYCFTHKADSMINVRAYRCQIESCTTQISSNDKYKGYCFSCFYINYPDEPVIRNHLIKEKTIMKSVSEALADRNIILNQRIDGSGCRRRPDGLVKASEHNIIIEVDENQHKYYGYNYEASRDSELYAALGKLPLTIIRFNPDSYWTKNGKYSGLFTIRSNGVLEIKNLECYNDSIKKLIESVQQSLQNPPVECKTDSNNIHTVRLRFDEL